MASPRRAAREFALLALYEIEVGKATTEEALSRSLERVRGPLYGPLNQSATEMATEMKQLIAERAPKANTIESRQFRKLARSAHKSVSEFATSCSEIIQELIRRCSTWQAEVAVERVAAQSVEGLLFIINEAIAAHISTTDGGAILEATTHHFGRIVDYLAKELPLADPTVRFMYPLVEGVQDHKAEIDRCLSEFEKGWALDRQAAVDRNILRLGALELLYMPDIPIQVSIDEAVELAKKFGGADSPRFVNGILGALAAKIGEKAQGPTA